MYQSMYFLKLNEIFRPTVNLIQQFVFRLGETQIGKQRNQNARYLNYFQKQSSDLITSCWQKVCMSSFFHTKGLIIFLNDWNIQKGFPWEIYHFISDKKFQIQSFRNTCILAFTFMHATNNLGVPFCTGNLVIRPVLLPVYLIFFGKGYFGISFGKGSFTTFTKDIKLSYESNVLKTTFLNFTYTHLKSLEEIISKIPFDQRSKILQESICAACLFHKNGTAEKVFRRK